MIQEMCDRRTRVRDGVRERLLDELRCFEWSLRLPALRESIRLIASSCFEHLTAEHIHDVANYRTVHVGDEVFFEKAFSPGKEAAVSLAIARSLGREIVLNDLELLEASVAFSSDHPHYEPSADREELSAGARDERSARAHEEPIDSRF